VIWQLEIGEAFVSLGTEFLICTMVNRVDGLDRGSGVYL